MGQGTGDRGHKKDKTTAPYSIGSDDHRIPARTLASESFPSNTAVGFEVPPKSRSTVARCESIRSQGLGQSIFRFRHRALELVTFM